MMTTPLFRIDSLRINPISNIAIVYIADKQ